MCVTLERTEDFSSCKRYQELQTQSLAKIYEEISIDNRESSHVQRVLTTKKQECFSPHNEYEKIISMFYVISSRFWVSIFGHGSQNWLIF